MNGGLSRASVERTASGGALDEHPGLQRYVKCFLETFLVDGQLDPRLRELVILRIAWLCEQPFEWSSHHRLARRVGVSDDEVLATRIGPAARRFGSTERTVLTAADAGLELWPPDGVGPGAPRA